MTSPLPFTPIPGPRPVTVPVQPGRVGAAADHLAQGAPAGDITLDFAKVPYVGSEELGSLIALNRKMRASGGKLRLVNVTPPVSGVFAVTRLDTLLEVQRAAS